jgi:hypothetical protein
MILRPSTIGKEITGISESLRQNQINLGKRELGREDGWHLVGSAGEPGFESNWQNMGGVYSPLAFRRDTEGKVHLRGQIKVSAASGTPTGATIFTLPSGYRPSQAFGPLQPLLGRVTGAGASWYWYRTLSITTGGVVVMEPGYDVFFLTLDNISFWTY